MKSKFFNIILDILRGFTPKISTSEAPGGNLGALRGLALHIRPRLAKVMRILGRLILPTRNLSKRNKRLLTITSLLVILVIIPIIIYGLTHLKGAEAAWFDSNFGYRQRVDITNSGSSQTDFQVAITLNTDTLYDNGKLRSDCNDIRITDTNGKLLPFWIETMATACGNGQTAQTIWVKVPSISTTGNTLYVYYGNPSASSYSNGNKVFEFFDDFSGSSIDGSKWSQGTIGATSGTAFSQSGGNLAGGNSNRYIQSVKTFTGNYATQSRSYTTTDNANGYSVVGFYASTSDGFGVLDHDNTSYYRNDSGWFNFALDGTGQWSRNTAQVVGTTATYTRTGETSGSATATGITNSGLSGEYVRLSTRYDDFAGDQNYVATWDWVFVRKAVTTAPSVASPTNEEKEPGPVAYWKFDEGTGTVANDSSSNKYNGTLGGSTLPSWKPESECISGKCLYFDSSNTANNPKVTLNESSTTKTNILGDVTISVWIKPTSNYFDTSEAILRNGQGADLVYSMFYNPTNQRPYFHWYDGAFKQVDASSNTAPLNKWTHVEIVRSGTNLSFYINGKLDSTSTVTAPTVSAGQLAIGQTNNDAVPQDYTGFLDDLKIYNYARTAAQIKTDYSSRGSVKGVSAALGGNNETMKQLSNGLVGYWKMDEASSTTTTTDSSGNGNTGSINLWGGGNTATSSARVTGKYGGGIDFDGGDDYVNVPDPSSGVLDFGTGNFTLSSWFYLDSLPNNWSSIINKGGSGAVGYGLMISNTNQYCGDIQGASGTNQHACAGTATAGVWHQLTVVFARSDKIYIYVDGALIGSPSYSAGNTNSVDNSNQFTIGSFYTAGTFFLNGKVDETRIYNRALSDAEVSQLYNFAPGPVGYWNFEEGNGLTANDSSGNANTGTWNGIGSHWTSGKYGKAGNFNGTDDFVNVLNSASLNPSILTVSAWAKSNTNTWNNDGFLVSKRDAYIIHPNQGLTTVNFYIYTTGWTNVTCTPTTPITQWNYYTMTWDGTNLRCYINGIQGTPATPGGSINTSDTGPLTIGRDDGLSRYLNGKIDDVRIYNYARTSGQIVSDMNAGHPAPGSPVGSQVAYWKFDEGYGLTSNDSSVNNLGLTLTNTRWSNNGKFGKSLVYSNSNAYATRTDTTSSPLDVGQPTLTISAWINPSVLTSGQTYAIVNKNGPYIFWIDGTNKRLYTGLLKSGVWYWAYSANNSITTGIWQHVTMTYDGTSRKLYVNGKQSGPTDTQISDSIDVTNGAVTIGYDNCCARFYFDGLMDEIKIYNSALTADEVKLDYNRGSSQVLGSLSDTSGLTGGSVASNSASAEYCIPGDTTSCASPVGRWDFEEGQGGTVNDISGNGLIGTMTNSATWTSGKFGKAGNFNGASVRQGVQVSNNALLNPGTGSFTTEAWIKTSQTGTWKRFTTKRGSSSTWYSMGINSGKLAFETAVSYSTYYTSTSGNKTINDDKWHHVVMVRDTSQSKVLLYVDGILDINPTDNTVGQSITNSEIFEIGIWGSEAYDTGSYTGKIDQVRIFNYARSAAQVAYDYNRGAPVGYWKMDECQGGNAYDSSGNGKTGTITIGGTGSQTVLGTCSTPTDGTGAWYNGRTGKYNSSLNFDGTNDYVSVGQMDIPSDITVAAWVYSSNYNQNGFIVGKNTVNTQWELFFEGTSLRWRGGAAENTVSCSLPTNNQWHYIVGKQSGTTGELYIDGVSCDTGTVTAIGNGSGDVEIGRFNGGYYFSGQIDDARIYNYVLTTAQIKQIYNQGAGVRFGPQTGTP